jgi:hypothetical protein
MDDLFIFFIDNLASNYHWSKDAILDDLCFEEAMEYSTLIKKRQINDYITQLAVISNPHTKNPKELLKSFQDELKKIENKGIIEPEREENATAKLKQIFSSKKKTK